MKKNLLFLATLVMIALFAQSAIAGENTDVNNRKDLDTYLWEINDDMSDDDYAKYSMRNFKFIQSIEPLIDDESYLIYSVTYSHFEKGTAGKEDLEEAFDNLILEKSVADNTIFLWDANNMPIVDGEEYTEEELDNGKLDAYGFIPLLVEYLIDTPEAAKGNIIVISGGGFSDRGNNGEGYECCEKFNELGYNTFLLQRRIEPYSTTDIYMDMQRAIRLVRYYAELNNWGGQDMIAAAGFSGGGMTIQGAVFECFGEKTPADEGASSYVPDEIDAVCSDLDVAMPIYGAMAYMVNDENPNLPAFYFCVGTLDTALDNCQETYDLLCDKTPCRIDAIEGAKHGFGVGTASSTPDGCREWPLWADEFMQSLR